jgi:chromosome-anchoring protein RacA
LLNTSEVANLLGVSSSTIKRWVKQLELQMERNERGHYLFTEETIEYLKFIQDQINQGLLLNEVATSQENQVRKGSVKKFEKKANLETIEAKIEQLERRLNDKADSVTSYQLLQHRSEIEDLQNLIHSLSYKIEKLEAELIDLKKSSANEQQNEFEMGKNMKKSKKKNIFSSLFGF